MILCASKKLVNWTYFRVNPFWLTKWLFACRAYFRHHSKGGRYNYWKFIFLCFLFQLTDLNNKDGKRKDSHQYRGYWPRRLRQVDIHRSLDLQMWWYWQESHREIREGSPRSKFSLDQFYLYNFEECVVAINFKLEQININKLPYWIELGLLSHRHISGHLGTRMIEDFSRSHLQWKKNAVLKAN